MRNTTVYLRTVNNTWARGLLIKRWGVITIGRLLTLPYGSLSFYLSSKFRISKEPSYGLYFVYSYTLDVGLGPS